MKAYLSWKNTNMRKMKWDKMMKKKINSTFQQLQKAMVREQIKMKKEILKKI